MKYLAALGIFALVLLPYASAMTVEWHPEHPKKGSVVTVYATLGVNESHNVKLEYCVGTACFYPSMKYENGKWVGNFTMPAENVDITILVDGEPVWNGTITGEGKGNTPSFEIVAIIPAFIATLLIWKRKN